MYSRIVIAGMELPSYGVMILSGVILSNILAILVAWKRKLSYETFLFLEIFAGVGAGIGAKVWFQIENGNMSTFNLEELMHGGWSFYGGFLLGILTIVVVCKMNRINRNLYASNFIFLVPFLHMFWKIGCFMAGCCYGIEGFPVQLLEAGMLGVVSIVFYIKGKRKALKYPISSYIFSYGCLRLVAEVFRYHPKGTLISMAQVVSLICIVGTGMYLFFTQNSIKRGGESCE